MVRDGLNNFDSQTVRSCLICDAAVTNTLAASYLPATSITTGAAAEVDAALRDAKYNPLLATHDSLLLAFETFGTSKPANAFIVFYLHQNG